MINFGNFPEALNDFETPLMSKFFEFVPFIRTPANCKILLILPTLIFSNELLLLFLFGLIEKLFKIVEVLRSRYDVLGLRLFFLNFPFAFGRNDYALVSGRSWNRAEGAPGRALTDFAVLFLQRGLLPLDRLSLGLQLLVFPLQAPPFVLVLESARQPLLQLVARPIVSPASARTSTPIFAVSYRRQRRP